MSDEILTQLHNSLAVRFGTSTPYSLGKPYMRSVGFAHLKMLCIPFRAPEADVSSVIPILRQRAYSYLGEHGLAPECVKFVPTVGQDSYYGGRRLQMFYNENESARDRSGKEIPIGARKRGLNGVAMFEFNNDEGRVNWSSGICYFKGAE